MTFVPPAEAAERAIRMVKEAPLLSYDTESSGLDWKRNFPVGYVFCTQPGDEIYVPVRHGGGGNLPGVPVPDSPTAPLIRHPFEEALAAAFKARVGLTVGHHLKFDCHFSANAGVMLGRHLSCTQNNEALLDEYAKSYSLDSCCTRHKVAAKKGQELYDRLAGLFGCQPTRSSMEHYWKTAGDDPVAWDYAAGDGHSTLELFKAQVKIIDEEDLRQVFTLENELIWTLFRMERRGIRVDEEYLPKLLELIESRVDEANRALPESFNVRSPTHVKEWVTRAGRTDWPTTDLGNPSFSEKWLKSFPEGKLIVTVRKWSNLANTFVKPLIGEHVFNGRVHPTLNQLKTEEHGTPARLSCSQPNLQAIPKRDRELATIFRDAFIADEGYCFAEADYQQCEPRLFAHYSKDPNLVDGYNQNPPRDVHTTVAEMLGVERDPTAKRMNMGILTGMFPKTFAGHLGVSIGEATELWNLWFSKFPGVRDFQDAAKRRILDRGYVLTLLKRRGRLENNRFAYRAVSKIIQGGNADILKWFLVKLDRWLEEIGDEVHLLMTVHDSIEWQFPDTPEGHAVSAEMLSRMVKVQEPPFNLRVPFGVDYGHGKSWSEATFGGKK